ncbi:hypothetical protein ACIP8I_02630 [Pseudomonas sp. NPDC088414]|uniref:hypothetical protein n=1 Tax=Pseudomonas sp. NPDC088414 TaxID=3364454 RepID=UPI0038109B5A
MAVPELESSFINSLMPINIKQAVSIRHCPDCLLKGYHSVFFYLKFITHCPWHKKRLIFCRACSEAMSQAGLGPKKNKDNNEVYFSLRLPCGHFSFDSRLGYDLGYNDQNFYYTLCVYSSEILGWLRRVPHCDEVASTFISCLYDGNSQNELGYRHCFNICSAKIGHATCLSVAPLSCKKIFFTPQHCARFDHTKPFSVLKSIRRYIYREYLRSHKKCLRTLMAMDRKQLHCLDVKCACAVSSAMLGWMYSLGYVPGNKSDNIQPPTLTLGGERPPMLKQVAILWLSQFYGIWASIENELQRASIMKGKFKISLSHRSDPNHVELSDHCVLITSSQQNSIAEFTVIIRDPSYLSFNSFQRCLGRLTHDRALSPASTWVVFHWAYEPSDEIIMRYWVNEATADRSHFQSVLLG